MKKVPDSEIFRSVSDALWMNDDPVTARSLQRLIPGLTLRKIEDALDHLVKTGVVIQGEKGYSVVTPECFIGKRFRATIKARPGFKDARIVSIAPLPDTEPANGIQPGESLWQRHLAIRAQYPDVTLLYRQGGFYQALGWDAEFISREFSLPLAHQDFGGESVPTCAIPYDESEKFVTPLLGKGRKVAIIEPPLFQVPEYLEIVKYGRRKMDLRETKSHD